MSAWQKHTIRQIQNDRYLDRPAQFQNLTKDWNRIVGMPYIVYMPEKDRILLVAYCDLQPCKAVSLISDDQGETWSPVRYIPTHPKDNPDFRPGYGETPTCLSYLGEGKVIFSGMEKRWFSFDFGETWEGRELPPGKNGKPWAGWQWEPYLVDRDPVTGKVVRIAEAAYSHEGDEYPKPGYFSQAYIRFSTDEGLTWSEEIAVPQWKGINEVTLFRAANGDMIAACRTDINQWYRDPGHRPDGLHTPDLYSGFGISISKDHGLTWSQITTIFDYGRHFTSPVILPNGDIIMTYVVRIGYPYNVDGFPTFGIEAIVSRDHGVTWDLEHRIILDEWTGYIRSHDSWWPSPQSTSSVLLPDGAILTVYGRAERCVPKGPPRDIGLLKWRLD
jgi:hypothetical protein